MSSLPSRAACDRTPSELARRAFGPPGRRPLFRCAWEDAVFIHFEVDPAALRRHVPFELDLREGKAYVSVVTITIRPLSLRESAPLLMPQSFLNVRTYVRGGGVHFLAGWIANPFGPLFGPRLAGLPYRFGRLDLRREGTRLRGHAVGAEGVFEYDAPIDPRERPRTPSAGSLEEFLLERYAAFTRTGTKKRLFRIWHDPWPFVPIEPVIRQDRLLAGSRPWFRRARRIGAHYSPGLPNVWMGRLEEWRAR